MADNFNISEEIKSRCNIVDVIGRVVPLKRSGTHYKGCCPFHHEKTPSFVVHEDKQFYYCFGCHASGDVIEFVKNHYNLEFMDACRKLADEYGIEIKSTYSGSSEQKERLYEINRLAARFFFGNIAKAGNEGLKYMLGRGITIDTIKKFGIGYAEDSWDSLYNYMKSQNVDPETLVDLGLLSRSKKGGYYDKFRNRVIFPIINTRGKVIGFGGRILGKGEPKYLNSPESDIFLKKNNLYGINLTRQEISAENMAILVEGYMDVVSLYQAGVKNVSASLGTALTENQAKMLSRYTKNIVLSYDADNAGRTAALRGIDILHKEGLKPKVLHVTDGKDPDEFIKKKGRIAFLELVEGALPFADYKLSVLMNRHTLETTEGRIEFIKDCVKILYDLSPAERDIYIKKFASITGISEGAIRMEMGEGITESEKEAVRTSSEEQEENVDISPMEKSLIKILLTEDSYYEKISPYEDVFTSKAGLDIYTNISDIYKESGSISIQKLKDSIERSTAATLDDIIDHVYLGGKEKEVFEDCIQTVQLNRLQSKYRQISSIIDLTDDSSDIKELMREQMQIQSQIRQLKERR